MKFKSLLLVPLLALQLAGETITGPTLTNNLGGWANSGIKITAINDCVLTSFVFNNQGKNDTIKLLLASDNSELQSISVSPSSNAETIQANWQLTAGTSYKILCSNSSSGKWKGYSNFPQTSTNLRVDSTVTLTSNYTTYWFSFTNLQISSSGATSPPVITQGAGPLSKTIDEDTTATWTTSELNATDSDTSASSLAWSLLSSPSNGTANVSGNGSAPTILSYQPNADYHGSDSFSVQVSDGDNNDSITINLTINPVDEPFNGSFDWANHAGGNNRTEAFSVDVFNDGSSLISGMFFRNANFGNSISLSATNDADGFAAKMNADGTFAWATKVGCTSSCRVADVAVLEDGSSIITGTWKGTATFENTSLTSNPSNYNDAFVAKLDANGNFVWVKQVGGTASDEAAGIAVFGDGSSVVTGGFSGTVDFGVKTLTSTNHLREIFVAKLDSDGNFLWASKAGGSGHDNVRDLTTIADGSTIITGDYASTANFGSFTLDEFGSISSFIAKLDANGSFLWATKAGENQCCSAVKASGFGVEASGDGSSIIATGYFEGECNFGEKVRTSSGSHDIFVTKLDSSGNYVWVVSAGGNNSDIGRSATLLSDGSSLITGQFQGTALFGDYALSSSGSNDVFVAKLDANGTTLWVLKAGGSSSDYPMKIASNGNNEVIAAGIFNQTASFGNTDLTSLGSLEAFAVSIQADSKQSPVITQGSGPLSLSVAEDNTSTWSTTQVSATDEDTSSSSLTWSLSSTPAHGTAVVNGTGASPANFSYTPNANFHGSDSFTVSVSDGGLSDSIPIDVTISSVNDATLISGDFNGTLIEDGNTTGDLNATDADGLTDGAYFLISSTPANGSASIDPVSGTWLYSANPDFHGSDSFTVSVTDDQNHSATLASVTLTITSVNDSTFISGDFNGTLLEDGNATGDLNATDADGLIDGAYFLISSDPANGSASIDPVSGTWLYSANPDFHGSDSFIVSVTDDQNHSATLASVTLTITSVNDSTLISGDFNGTLLEDGNATGDLNATDVDGLTDGAYFLISSTPANGSASIDPVSGTWLYSANPDFHGSDSFSVSVTDDQNHSATLASVTLTITSVNDSTFISGDFNGTLLEDGNATGDLNATDADGLTDGAYFLISSTPANGSASIDPVSGTWLYSANPDFRGSDSFSVSVTDDQNHSATLASVTLTITSVNDSTFISGDFNGTLMEDGNASGDLNATDADGLNDGTYFLISSTPANGSASIDPASGTWLYSANQDFHGSDSFIVSVTDDQNHSATLASVTLTITSVNDSTFISGDFNGTLMEDGNASGDLNATDADGLNDGTYFLISSTPANGSASIDSASGTWLYSANPDFHGSDSFIVSVTDDQNHSATLASVTLTITSVNDSTFISGDFNGTLMEDGNASGDLNATDADGLTDGAYFLISSTPANGSASIDSASGTWLYSANPDFHGSDSFIVSVTDDQNHSATLASVTLTITSVNDSTFISGDFNGTLMEDGNASGDLNATDADGLTDGTIYSISSDPNFGTANLDPASGNWFYTSQENYHGSDAFTVSVTDDENNTATFSEITLLITSVDDPTMVTGDFNGTLLEDGNASGDLNATDADGLSDQGTFILSSAPLHGSASVDSTSGQWTYAPRPFYYGTDSFVISIFDSQGIEHHQQIRLEIEAVPDPNPPLVEMLSVSLDQNGSLIATAELLTDGGFPVLDIGFELSRSHDFESGTRIPTLLESNESEFSITHSFSESGDWLYVRPYARNLNGETFGQTSKLSISQSETRWLAHSNSLDAGWYSSDWLGTFIPYPNDWIYHLSLGWLYVPEIAPEGTWLWSSNHDWVWTSYEAFPHFYRNALASWIYLIPTGYGKSYYDYTTQSFQ